MLSQEAQKKIVGEKAAEYVFDDMIVGLGTGSTVKYAIEALADKKIKGVPTSKRTEVLMNQLGIPIVKLDEVERLDVAIDGADQIDVNTGICIKGGGGAHYMEKMVEKRADKLIIIVDSSKVVEDFVGCKIPLEIEVGAQSIIADYFKNENLIFSFREPLSDSGNLIGDVVYDGRNPLYEFNEFLEKIDGVLGTGIFINMVKILIVSDENGKIQIYNY